MPADASDWLKYRMAFNTCDHGLAGVQKQNYSPKYITLVRLSTLCVARHCLLHVRGDRSPTRYLEYGRAQ